MDEKIAALINKHVSALGIPCAGTTSDIWSLSSCRESFGCLRGSFVLDGDIVAEAYRGKLVDFSPVLAFSRFEETRHTGAALALEGCGASHLEARRRYWACMRRRSLEQQESKQDPWPGDDGLHSA